MEKIDKPEEVVFYDGVITIINEESWAIGTDEWLYKPFEGKKVFLDAESDNPISLADINKNFPHVERVIYETCLEGVIYDYNNYSDGKWYENGKTGGYA